MDTLTVVGLVSAAFFVGYVLGRSGAPSSAPAVPPVPPDLGVLEQVRPILAADGKIAAIRAYREATGVGLRDAKLAVDTLHATS